MKRKKKHLDEYRNNILFNFDLNSSFGAAFYNLLGKMHLQIKENSLKTILVTSTSPGEGKTIVATNLALGFALLNDMKTVVIDSDLFHPSLHHIFDLNKAQGISEILVDKCSFESALIKLNINNLNVITSGKLSPSTSMLLGSNKMGELIQHLKGLFDIILIDTAPLISSSDPLVLCPYVDGVILVIEANKTQRELIQRAQTFLEATHVKILGVVLNKKEHILPRYVYNKLYHYTGGYY